MPSPVFIETGLSSSPSKQRLSSSSMMKKMCSCGYLQDMGNLFATMIVPPFLFDYKLGTYDHIQPRTGPCSRLDQPMIESVASISLCCVETNRINQSG